VTARTTYVYGLYEGFSNVPFYIGVSMEPKRRLSAHRSAANGKRKDSLTGCGVRGEDISMRLLASCDDRGNAETIEKALQKHYELHIVKTERLIRDLA
jgi:predicted GIY-YIG superfamily endonuclease